MSLKDSLASIEKRFGKETVMLFGDKPTTQIDVISTGVPTLDAILGIGGLPRGRIVEIFGPESCLSGDSFLQYEVLTTDHKRKNYRNRTIEKLYELFRTTDFVFFVLSVDEENRVIRNEVLDVVKTGLKECFEVITNSGKKLKTTKDHKFLTTKGYIKLGDIVIGDTVYIRNNQQVRAIKDTITSIKSVGIEETYDLKCAYPYNNYIANGIVVHNCGKTTMALHIIAEAQKQGGQVAYVDVEHAVDSEYSKTLGVDMDKVLFSQPSDGETALEVTELLIRSGEISVVVVDSVAALTPRSEIDGEMGDANVGKSPRLMAQAIRKLIHIVSETNTLLVFINQLRCINAESIVINNGEIRLAKECKVNDTVDFNKIELITKDYSREALNIEIKNSPSLQITKNHQQVITSETGLIVKIAENLVVGDWTVKPIEYNLNKNTNYSFPLKINYKLNNAHKDFYVPEDFNEDLSEFLGMYHADGCIGRYGGTSVLQFTEVHLGRRKLLISLINKLFKLNKDLNSSHISLCGEKYVQFIEHFNIGANAKEKRIPIEYISKGGFQSVSAFVKGCSFDSHIATDANMFIITLDNKQSFEMLKTVLTYCNIQYTVSKERPKTSLTKRMGWHIKLSGLNLVKYGDIIGFYGYQKEGLVMPTESFVDGRGVLDSVPRDLGNTIFLNIREKCKNLTNNQDYSALNACYSNKKLNYSRVRLIRFAASLGYKSDLIDFISNHRFNQITAIENTTIDTVDFSITGNHLFTANGILTHNSNIGAMGYGPTEITTGGKALKYGASVRLDVRRIGDLKDGEKVVGNKTKIKVVKNKLAAPAKQVEVDLIFGEGFSKESSLLDLAIEKGVIVKKGAWFHYNEKSIGQGRENVRKFLKDKDFYNEILDMTQDTTSKVVAG